MHTYHINAPSALFALCVQGHLDNSIFERRVGSITPRHYTTPLESISRCNNKRAVNNQPQQEEAISTKITLEIIYLDYPQTNSTNTTIDLVTPGTQGNIDQPCNVGQTNSLLQPRHNKQPSDTNAYHRIVNSHRIQDAFKFAHGGVDGPKRGRLKRNQFHLLDWNLKRGE